MPAENFAIYYRRRPILGISQTAEISPTTRSAAFLVIRRKNFFELSLKWKCDGRSELQGRKTFKENVQKISPKVIASECGIQYYPREKPTREQNCPTIVIVM